MATVKRYVYVGSDQVIVGAGNYVYILLEVSSQKAYLEGAGTPADSSQIAYLKGEDATLDSQSAYMMCEMVADSSISAYLKGRAIASQSAYLSGPAVDWIDDCEDKNTWASQGTLSNSTDAKQGTYSTQTSATPLAAKFYKATFGTPFAITTPFTDPCIHLWLYLTNASALSDWGQIEITSSGIADNQELHWNISNDKITTGPFGFDIQLEDGWNEIYLRIAEGIPSGGTFNGSIRHFRLAYTTSMNQIVRIDDVYITEYTYYKSSVSAFLTSDDILAEDTAPAFLEGKADADSNKSAYMFCGTVTTSSAHAYMTGDPIPASDSKSAYLYGGTNIKDSQAAFMSMGTIAEGTVSAFMDAESTTSAIKSCFLEGQHPRSYQSAFMIGQWAPTADDSTGAFLDSDGAWPFSDNFTGDDEDNWSEYKWLTGRNE